ncbi:major facilitator superfamily transporter [Podospora conica]|nr:major facilitator superfamily transporter [Schizothecium conicum]
MSSVSFSSWFLVRHGLWTPQILAFPPYIADMEPKDVNPNAVDGPRPLSGSHFREEQDDWEAQRAKFEAFDREHRKAILRKMDMRLIPMLALLYLMSFLDRGNIGNAKIEGLATDLNLTPNQYNTCLTVFFFTYAAFEVPSNLVLKRLRPSRWLPTIMVAWGVVMTLMGLVQSYGGLVAARVALGVAEAGLFPGVAYYLTMWYTRAEMQLRQALFFSAASVAGAFSGLLAFAIAKMDGVGGLEGWRWIFVLEGMATVAVAVGAFWGVHDFPETAGFLSEEEREFVVFRLRYQGQLEGDGERGLVAEAEGFKWEYVRQAFLDWQIWVSVFVYWGIVCPLYGISLFLPSIIRNLGYTSSSTQLLTIPVYITASILAVAAAWFSDRVGKRSPFIIGFLVVMVAGFTMCISSSNPKVVYAGVFLSTCAIYPAFPGIISWLSNNLAGSYKRSAGMALQIGVGNLGGAMASNFYREKDSPRYILGHALELGFIGAGIVAALILVFSYTAINKKRERLLKSGHTHTYQELSEKGDKAVTFRYML